IDVVADRGTDPGQLARGHRGAHARTADEDAALGVPRLNRLADVTRLVGIVDRLRVRIRSEVDELVAQTGDLVEDRLAQLPAPVIEGDRDLHDWTVPHPQSPRRAPRLLPRMPAMEANELRELGQQ